MNDKQLQFIKNLAEKMSSQDFRSTQYPLFYIHEKEEVFNEDGDGRTVFMSEDWCEVDEYETSQGLWKFDSESDTWKLDSTDGEEERLEEDGFDIDARDFVDQVAPNLHIGYMKEEDKRIESVGPFFTEEAANLHISQNDYHYRKPFTYVDSAWRNYEMQEVMKMIFVIAGKEVPSWYK